ncbi:hypothetical protein SAMN06264364_1096 [Quadrisphaera granulorum]|uniref:Uncharacterized protein n=1 Tax=Quadrisphaera granulorum TaxID=317664 RepID=A0A316AV01_9ACTN|nr:hypothetical protein BXY45_1096 [Quadrisphaera granulorum]SZE96384.1 hypothetical protein SAMN06264364_1096 [Quadrisphaera granulorum]
MAITKRPSDSHHSSVMSRRALLASAALLTTACGSNTVHSAPAPATAQGAASSASTQAPLRTLPAPFTGEPPRVVILRDTPPSSTVDGRWQAGITAQATAAHLDAFVDRSATDGPTLQGRRIVA